MDGKGKARGVFGIILVLGALILCGPGASFGGDLEPTAGPGEEGTYTLQDVYDRLHTGAAGTLSTATAPSAGPADSRPTVNEIMGKAPAIDDTDGATEADVAEGKTFWRLTTGQWGPSTGSLAAETVENDTVQQGAGIYEAFDLSTIDEDLASGNIKSGAEIFGVVGDSNVVDTSSGDAVAEDIADGKIAWVDGTEITGTASAGGTCTQALVPRTGQTTCYDASGSTIDCTDTGQDGALQAGLEWHSPRFTDNTNGTVTDNLTGLVWLKNANCDGAKNWTDALAFANSLENGDCDLTDGSSAGEWRLPNIKELHSLIHWGYYSPALSNTGGDGKWTDGDPFTGVGSSYYWSSTSYAIYTVNAWYVALSYGHVGGVNKTNTHGVWPVRDGQ